MTGKIKPSVGDLVRDKISGPCSRITKVVDREGFGFLVTTSGHGERVICVTLLQENDRLWIIHPEYLDKQETLPIKTIGMPTKIETPDLKIFITDCGSWTSVRIYRRDFGAAVERLEPVWSGSMKCLESTAQAYECIKNPGRYPLVKCDSKI